MSATQLKKVSWWHQSIVDWELANPDKTMNECAAYFKVTASYLSIVRNSDAFMSYAAMRRADHNDTVSKSIVERTEELAGTALDVLNERIEAERENIGLNTVVSAADLALKSLGFGARGGVPAAASTERGDVNVFVNATKEELGRARELMNSVPQMITVNGEEDEVSAA